MLERIRAGTARAGEVCAAGEQPGARGRRERRWVAAEGGLWFTAALPLYGESIGWAGMAAALAVCRALDEVGLRAGVKWPNDVVIGAKKLAGVLVEGVAGRKLAAVGIGLNVRNDVGLAVASTWPPTSVSLELGRRVEPEELLEPILARMAALWEVWAAGRVAELREFWSERDACRGRRVRVLPAGPEGVADGIDLSGALRVRLKNGSVRAAMAGEIAFVDPTG